MSKTADPWDASDPALALALQQIDRPRASVWICTAGGVNSPSRGVMVAFIEVRGAPVELMQIDHQARPDL